jgi:phage protein D
VSDKQCQIVLNGKSVSQELGADLVSLMVIENTNMATTLTMKLTTKPDDQGAWAYLDDARFDPFTKVSVKLGFASGGGLAAALGAVASALSGGGGNDGLEPIFDGYITSVHLSLGSEPDEAHVEVSATDTSVLLSLEEKIHTWKDMSDSDIVEQIVGAYGVTVQADSTATVHQESDTTIAQRGTDIQFVRERAALNGLEFYFETDKNSGQIIGFFREPQLDGTPQSDLNIQFGEQSNLRNFSARLVGQRPLNVKIEQLDVKANGTNIGQASDTQLNKLGATDANGLVGGALGSLLTPQDAQAQMLVAGPPTSDATELQTIAQAVRDEAAWFITAEGEINSDAYQAVLRPHRLVLVKGAGKPFSGKYYVTRVIHELKGDGTYTQRFHARRNARDVDGSEKFGGSGLGLAIPSL